jgi:Trk K+ transport system NAD-binding subunit
MSQTPTTSYDVVVLGGGSTGIELATELSGRGRRVAVFDDETAVERARRGGLTAHESPLESANPPLDCSAETVVVATASDARNLLLAAAASRAFGADRVVALVNDPDRRAAYDDAGIDTVCVSRTVARETIDSITLEESTSAARATESTERVRLRD